MEVKMSERKGFWSQRPRKGEDDAQLIVTEVLHDLRQAPYAKLRDGAGQDATTEELTGLSGEKYACRTSIVRRGSGAGEQLDILVQVYKPSILGRLNPLAERLVHATPDGEMVGEYTLASEHNDVRRFDWETLRAGGEKRTSGDS
jgi:hypothetical protein